MLWLAAALFDRLTIPLGLYEGGAFVWLLALTVPATVVLVRSVGLVARLGQSRIVAGVALAGASATMLDGTAFGFFSWIYSTEPDIALRAAAWILWGVGAGQFVAQGAAWWGGERQT